jgi:hypothetical protein
LPSTLPSNHRPRLGRYFAARPTRGFTRQAGALLGKSATNDPVDATVVAIAASGDHILTSDVDDIHKLVTASRRAIHVVPC